MNDGLIDGFRHNAWAMRELLLVCQPLTDEQLATTVPGTYGSIIDTLRHTVASEAGYYRRLSGDEPDWFQAARELPGVADLLECTADLAARWDRFLETPFDAERLHVIPWHDGIDRDVPSGIVLVQALHHANEHRSQIATALTSIGVNPPGWGLWEFAEATNRAPQRRTASDG